jgi:phage-related protein
MGFFDRITSGFSSAFNYVKDKATSAYNYVANAISGAGQKVESVVQTLHQDARDLVSGAGNLIGKTEDTYKDVVVGVFDKTGSTITGVADSARGAVGDVSKGLGQLGWPLAVGAVAVAAVMLLKK